MTVHIGFTGTRAGMTSTQMKTFQRIIGRYAGVVLHHGDCLGADENAHRLVTVSGGRVEIWPPDKDAARAYLHLVRPKQVLKVHEVAPYLERNRSIVENTEFLIAVPHTRHMTYRGSGTWYTFRYARDMGKKIRLILPSGRVRGADYVARS